MTLKQLAKKLNVSISTVSKALNDSHEISKDTIKRVKELAALYNYVPNKSALSLKQSKTKTIGVIVPNILNHFFAKALVGIEKEATKNGYQIIVCLSNESLKKEQDNIQWLTNGSVDGLIFAVAEETIVERESSHFKKLLDLNIPFVMFDRVLEDVKTDKVIINDTEAGYKATKSFINQGRKKIGLINCIDNLNVAKLRQTGYEKAIIETFGELNQKLILKTSINNIQDKIKMFLNENELDAILAIDNVTGVIAINIAKSLKFSIPKDISIIGFADSLIARYAYPTLTTLDSRPDLIGSTACKQLIHRLDSNQLDSTFPKLTVIDTKISSGGSF